MRGFDAGTKNLVKCTKNKEGKYEVVRETNAFVALDLENRFMFNMLKKSGVKLVERDKVAYVIGDDAINLCYSMPNLELRRPMKDGAVNATEKQAFSILSTMIHSLIGEIESDGELLCYCVPAPSINKEIDVDYHQKVIQSIMNKYEFNGKKLNAFAIQEGLALIYAELMDQQLTGIGCSFGSGQVNICVSNMGVPVIGFSVVNSGDWIDKQSSAVTGESIAFITKEKEKIDLTKAPTNLVERAIQTQYRIMIEKTMKLISEKLKESGNKIRIDRPLNMILAGGTSLPNGFDLVVKEVVSKLEFPLQIGEIKKPKDPLFSVARGCYLAAENSM